MRRRVVELDRRRASDLDRLAAWLYDRAACALDKYHAAMDAEDERQRASRLARAATEFDRHFPGGSKRVIAALERT